MEFTDLGIWFWPQQQGRRIDQVLSLASEIGHMPYTYIHTHPLNGPFSGTTRVSRYQKVKPIYTYIHTHKFIQRQKSWGWIWGAVHKIPVVITIWYHVKIWGHPQNRKVSSATHPSPPMEDRAMRPYATSNENEMRFGHLIFEICSRTDCRDVQTDIQRLWSYDLTALYKSLYYYYYFLTLGRYIPEGV